MDSVKRTQPVILVGPFEQEAKGFNRVHFISERADGLRESETHKSGKVFVQMVGGILLVRVVSEE